MWVAWVLLGLLKLLLLRNEWEAVVASMMVQHSTFPDYNIQNQNMLLVLCSYLTAEASFYLLFNSMPRDSWSVFLTFVLVCVASIAVCSVTC